MELTEQYKKNKRGRVFLPFISILYHQRLFELDKIRGISRSTGCHITAYTQHLLTSKGLNLRLLSSKLRVLSWSEEIVITGS